MKLDGEYYDTVIHKLLISYYESCLNNLGDNVEK